MKEQNEDQDPFALMFKEDSHIEDLDDSFEDLTDNFSQELKSGTFVGTPYYASPEMLASSISGTFTDLWALGVIIYEMLEGKTPW